jgi:hypothetical protein
MRRYSYYRNGVHKVSEQVLRDTAGRLGTQILPLEVSLLPGMAKNQPQHITNTFTLNIFTIFSGVKNVLFIQQNSAYNMSISYSPKMQ